MDIPSSKPASRTVKELVRSLEPIRSNDPCARILPRFLDDAELHALPVVNAGSVPIALLDRKYYVEFFSRLYARDIFSRRSVAALLANPQFSCGAPIVVDEGDSIEDVARLILNAGVEGMVNGFIICRDGRYAGVGNGHAVLKLLTEQNAAALKESEERLVLALRGSRDDLWDRDLLTRRDHFSERWCEMLGYTVDEITASGDAWKSVVHPDDLPHVMAAVRAHLERDVRYDTELRLRAKSGEYIWFRVRGEAVRDADGKPERMAGAITDINSQKRAELALRERDTQLVRLNEELEGRVQTRTQELAGAVVAAERAREEAERANRAKSEFLSRMSHELRTPLNAILGFAQILGTEPLAAEQADYVREVEVAGEHLLELIDEVLDLARIDAGHMEVLLKPVEVLPVVEQALKLIGPLVQQKGLKISYEVCSGTHVQADAMRLRQVLVNLLSNAAKYNRTGGSIRVHCAARGAARLRVSVSDTGLGIAPERRADLFKPFERLGAENSGVDGTGIGLALSKRLVELMGGELGVDTEPGRGATFWIDTPLAGERPLEAMPTLPEDAVAGAGTCAARIETRRVLYVEDNPANLRMVEGMLKRRPELVLISADSGENGLKFARRYRPEVILLDIHLPGMSGFDVKRVLASEPELKDTPVIALSADAMPHDIERAMAAGFSAYVTKPVKAKTLLDSIDGALGKRETEIPA